MICVGILLETDTLQDFLSSLWQDFDWTQITHVLSWKAMTLTDSAIKSETGSSAHNLFDSIFEHPRVLSSIGSIGPHEAAFLLRMIWEDRASFFMLCDDARLAGSSMLLYRFYRIIMGSPENM